MHKLVTMQSDINDCAPAVIYSLVKYYNGYVSIEKIRIDTNLDKEGVTAYDIVITLRRYGFDTQGLKLTIDDLKKVSNPIILHLNLNKYYHYVLLLKTKNDVCTIMDPSKGIIKMSLSELASLWTNIAINAIPSDAIIKLNKSTSLFCLTKKLVCQNKKSVASIIILGLTLNILNIILSYYLQFLNISSSYLKIIVIFLILTILKIISKYYFTKESLQFNKSVDKALTFSYIKHFLHLPLPYLEKATSGRTLKHIEDLQIIKEAILEFLLKITMTVCQFILGFILIINLNLLLSIFVMLIILSYTIFKVIENKKMNCYINYLLDKNNIYQDSLIEIINGYKTIKDINQENYFYSHFQSEALDYFDYQNSYGNTLNKWQSMESILLELGNFSIVSYGFVLYLQNKIALIGLFTFITLANYLIYNLEELLDIMPKYRYLKQSYNRISEFGDISTEDKESRLPFSKGDITFCNVSFNYNNGNNVIKNLNQSIKKGEKVILLGPSGTGKSTLCKLLYRYYNLQKGSITINNINIENINLNSLRSNIGYVSQDAILFNKTIKDNIVLGKTLNLDKLNKILKICELEGLIFKLPNHLETRLQESGNNLSGGEIERIILARSLYDLKPIMIFDEALSQVDIATEKKIIKNILGAYKNCTLIYISHKDVQDLFKKQIKLF